MRLEQLEREVVGEMSLPCCLPWSFGGGAAAAVGSGVWWSGSTGPAFRERALTPLLIGSGRPIFVTGTGWLQRRHSFALGLWNRWWSKNEAMRRVSGDGMRGMDWVVIEPGVCIVLTDSEE